MYQQILYKPRKDNSGMAANFNVNERGCFLTLAKQMPSTGEFDAFEWKDANGKHKHVISLGLPDLGAILSLFEGTTKEVKLYHEFPKDAPKDAPNKMVTTVNASPYSDSSGNARGYSFNIFRNKEKLGFGVSFAEAETLKPLLRQAVMNLSRVELKKKP